MGIEGAKHVNEAPEQKDDFSDTKKELQELDAELQVEQIRPVEQLSSGIVVMPIDWEGDKFNFKFCRTGSNVCKLQVIKNDKEFKARDGSIVAYSNSEYLFENDEEALNWLFDLVTHYVGADVAEKTVGKQQQLLQLLQNAPITSPKETSKEESNYFDEQVEQLPSEIKAVEEIGLLKVNIPYNWEGTQRDIIFQRIGKEKFTYVIYSRSKQEGKIQESASARKTVSLGGKSDFYRSLGQLLDKEIGKDRAKIPDKADAAWDILSSATAERVVDQSEYASYEEGRYTFSLVKEKFEQIEQSLDFGELPADEHFWITLNAVLDYNKQISEKRSPEVSNGLFLPKDSLLYQEYIDQVRNLDRSESPSAQLESTEKTKRLLKSEIDFLVAHGRNGFLDVGARAKKHKENYDWMRLKYLEREIQGVGPVFPYVKEQFNNSTLPRLLKELGPYVPMQESGYRNINKLGHPAKGVWQFMKHRATVEGLIVNGDRDDRLQIRASTKATIDHMNDLYDSFKNNSSFVSLADEFTLSQVDKEVMLSFMTLNAFNSGPGHMLHFLKTVSTSPYANKELHRFVEKYGTQGIILYLTNEYPRHADLYQKRFSRKYLIDSPEYVYNILKYYQLAHEAGDVEGDIALTD